MESLDCIRLSRTTYVKFMVALGAQVDVMTKESGDKLARSQTKFEFVCDSTRPARCPWPNRRR